MENKFLTTFKDLSDRELTVLVDLIHDEKDRRLEDLDLLETTHNNILSFLGALSPPPVVVAKPKKRKVGKVPKKKEGTVVSVAVEAVPSLNYVTFVPEKKSLNTAATVLEGAPPSPSALTPKEIKTLAMTAIKEHGLSSVVSILETFKCTSLTGLQETDYVSFKESINGLLGEVA